VLKLFGIFWEVILWPANYSFTYTRRTETNGRRLHTASPSQRDGRSIIDSEHIAIEWQTFPGIDPDVDSRIASGTYTLQ